jgi:hypothetical protein
MQPAYTDNGEDTSAKSYLPKSPDSVLVTVSVRVRGNNTQVSETFILCVSDEA